MVRRYMEGHCALALLTPSFPAVACGKLARTDTGLCSLRPRMRSSARAAAGWAENISALLPCGSPDPVAKPQRPRRHSAFGPVEAFLNGRSGAKRTGSFGKFGGG